MNYHNEIQKLKEQLETLKYTISCLEQQLHGHIKREYIQDGQKEKSQTAKETVGKQS